MENPNQTIQLTDKIVIPSVGFGTYLVANEDTSFAVSTAIGAGYRHVDTAEGYGNEEGAGAGVQTGIKACGLSRDDIFITTKLWPGNPAWGNDLKTGQDTINALNSSLVRLQLDYVDMYLIHAPFCTEHRLEQWSALVELRDQGKTRAIGVSNYSEAHIEEIKSAGLPLPDANQIELHPWSQKPALVSFLTKNGIKAIAYSSLVPLSGWRAMPGQDSGKTDQMKADGDGGNSAFLAMAKKYGITESQVLLRWGVQKGYPVLPKSMNPERMRQNIDLFGFSIDDKDMATIERMDRGEGVAWPNGDPTLSR